MIRRMKEMKKLFLDSQTRLNELCMDPTYTIDYFKAQWDRQRECQLQVIDNKSIQALTERLAHLVELEEQLKESHLELKTLRRKRHRQTQAERHSVTTLPETMVVLEEEIDSVIEELGGDKFRNIPGATSRVGNHLIRVRVAKSKLYEAKVGVLEEIKQSNQRADHALDRDVNRWMMDLVLSITSARREDHLVESRQVLEALLCNLSRSHCHLWMSWNQGLLNVLSGTSEYTNLPIEEETGFREKWNTIIENSKDIWARITKEPVMRAEGNDLLGDGEDDDIDNQLDDMYNDAFQVDNMFGN
ncbi:uncharacterized protein MELLADRAFT_113026 [Melampsora larici-populina 98AG31]|uniref:Uncharacterized protein n=1 Tax=Melampsora larici-populina (strain 98AG31 / pathotype 3-4-7) TaxID=747676 RepID=F4S8J4_MELLP|nr:uncharacterized protein MELLADRAFT_113026 [Melampsora larici-populina 98AG31]EGF98999.1 hypothetical protein MELLADRAFT_113026 [Melampsora larici-populina 98AG31]